MAVTRRRFFAGSAAAVAVSAAVAGCDAVQSAAPTADFGGFTEPFLGKHQGGIATAPQAHAVFIALDLMPHSGRSARDTLAAILKLWTSDAERLTQGQAALADTEPELALRPARLTITVGLGGSVFDRTGLGSMRPKSSAALPPFRTDRLDSKWSGGDICLQVCADDPVVVSHTSRVLLKSARSMTRRRWRQTGFRNAYGANQAGGSMRNLMGQVDGTVNLHDDQEFDRYVWDDGSDQPWFAGGTILVVRRIRAEMDTWDEFDRGSKEFTVGRRLDSGSPLTGEKESDEPDFDASVDGIPVIPLNSHIALARHRTDDERFLRRPYNYDDAPTGDGITDCGLIFAAYQRDPASQFVPVQERLAGADALNQWITTIGSATFAILPGVETGGFLGEGLLG